MSSSSSLELFQTLERGQFVVRQRAEGAVLEDGPGDLVFGLFQRLGELGRDLIVVAVAGRQALQGGRLDALLEVRRHQWDSRRSMKRQAGASKVRSLLWTRQWLVSAMK